MQMDAITHDVTVVCNHTEQQKQQQQQWLLQLSIGN